MLAHQYLMENAQEAFRMSMKTDPETIEQQAEWAGLKPDMRIADIGCGPGKTTRILSRLVGPGGHATGIDCSQERIDYARAHFGDDRTRFLCRDIKEPLDDLGPYDFVWVRFLLEYFRSSSFELVSRLSNLLKPGGTLCLIDLDLNCLNHYSLPKPLESSLKGMMGVLEEKKDFDPYAGRKLYSYLYDLNYQNINVELSAHHLIYGRLAETDAFNWMTKTMVAARNSGYDFYQDFDTGFDGFYDAFRRFFADPRRFTYTPVIVCSGRRGLA